MESLAPSVLLALSWWLATLGGVRNINSYSDADQVQIGVEFDWGRDVNLLRLEVKEKLDQIRGELPSDIPQILLLTFDSSDIPVIEGRIAAAGRDLSTSWDLLEQHVIAPLQRIPGVGRAGLAPGLTPFQATSGMFRDRGPRSRETPRPPPRAARRRP